MPTCPDSETAIGGVDPACNTIDIGCVPVTSGEPSFTPEPDQLPLAVDPSTKSIWLYQCPDGSWVEISASLCKLDPVDISILNDICSVLRIPVSYDVAGNCVEGDVTLQAFADQLIKCIPPYPVVVGDELHITVTPSTDPDTGQITYTVSTDLVQVEVIGDDNHIIVTPTVDDNGDIVYMVSTDLLDTCEKDLIPQSTLDDAVSTNLEVCVTDSNGDMTTGLIPLPEPPEDNGPLTCIPVVSTQDPDGPAPDENESPVRLDCSGALWLYKCDGTGWHKLEFTLAEFEQLVPSQVANICNNLKFHTWYDDPDCRKDREITLSQLVTQIQKCICANLETGTIEATHAMVCNSEGVFELQPIVHPTFCELLSEVDPVNQSIDPSLVQVPYVDQNGNCRKGPLKACCDAFLGDTNGGVQGGACVLIGGSGVFQFRDYSVVEGTGSLADIVGGTGTFLTITAINPDPDSFVTAIIRSKVFLNERGPHPTIDSAVSAVLSPIFAVSLPSAGEQQALTAPLNSDWGGADISRAGIARFTGPGDLASVASIDLEARVRLAPGASQTFYSQVWYGVNSPITGGVVVVHAYMAADIYYLRGPN